MTETKKVYAAINAVQADLAKEGIGKTNENQQQHYKFRGIDDVYNALAPSLAKHKLCILPKVIARSVMERESRGGGTLFCITVEAEFDFVSAEDGSIHTVKTFGEAMDSADKATNKAMSAAYKYACIQTFCIPTEGDNDADAVTHDPKAKAAQQPPQRKSEAKPAEPKPERKSETDKRLFAKGKVIEHTPPNGKGPHAFKVGECMMLLKTFDADTADALISHQEKNSDVEVEYEIQTRGKYTNAMIVSIAAIEEQIEEVPF